MVFQIICYRRCSTHHFGCRSFLNTKDLFRIIPCNDKTTQAVVKWINIITWSNANRTRDIVPSTLTNLYKSLIRVHSHWPITSFPPRVMLEKFSACDHTIIDQIKGCIVDSAPVATPDPQVWAAGFFAALLKKQSVATKGLLKGREGTAELLGFDEAHSSEPKPDVAETALLVMLENFFELLFKLPYVDRRLSDVFRILSHQQPQCPQLYIYSSADKVIPAESVEAFIVKQKKAGYKVTACNFVLSPHVDHFRKFPELYSAQLSSFLKECLHCHKEQNINV